MVLRNSTRDGRRRPNDGRTGRKIYKEAARSVCLARLSPPALCLRLSVRYVFPSVKYNVSQFLRDDLPSGWFAM